MKRKSLATLLILMIVTCAISFTAMAAITPPTAIGAPEHFGVLHYPGDSFTYTASTPDDIRALRANSKFCGGMPSPANL